MHQRHVGNTTLDGDFISWYLQLADNIPEESSNVVGALS